MNIFQLLLTDTSLRAHAAALGVAGLVIVIRCMMRNFNPEWVSMPSVVKHTLVSMPILFIAGMLYTASRLPEGANLSYIVDIGLGLSLPLILVSMLISIAPPMLAMLEHKREMREQEQSRAARLRKQQPWSLTA